MEEFLDIVMNELMDKHNWEIGGSFLLTSTLTLRITHSPYDIYISCINIMITSKEKKTIYYKSYKYENKNKEYWLVTNELRDILRPKLELAFDAIKPKIKPERTTMEIFEEIMNENQEPVFK